MSRKRWLASGLIVTLIVLGVAVGLWLALRPPGQEGAGSTPSAGTPAQGGAALQEPPGGEPPARGPAEAAQVQESVEYTIRDASGKVKEHKVIGR
ncbi:MAG: hypothetical protein Q8O76_10165 [Chloroflexota bacterium]|nr:hypothetical protein [Chloroflexota bacterium]